MAKTGEENRSMDGLIDTLFSEATQLHLKGDVERAAQKYQSILSVRPRFRLALNRMGLLELQMGHHQKALGHLSNSLQLCPQDTEAQVFMVCCLTLFETQEDKSGEPPEKLLKYFEKLRSQIFNYLVPLQRETDLESFFLSDSYQIFLTQIDPAPSMVGNLLVALLGCLEKELFLFDGRSIWEEKTKEVIAVLDQLENNAVESKKEILLDKAKLYWLLKEPDKAEKLLKSYKELNDDEDNAEASCLDALWNSKPSSSLLRETSSKQRLIFHMGWSKAGSSWLQTQFFPQISPINYLGKTTFVFGKYNGEADISGQYPASYSEFKLFSKDLNMELFNRALEMECDRKRVNLFSHEGLSGRGGELVLSRLETIKENYDVKAVLIIRRQADLLWSYYCYGIARGDIEEGTKFNVNFFNGFLEKFDLDFNGYYDRYAEQFGQENIRIIPFEALWGECMGMKDLAQFIGVTVEESFYDRVNDMPRVNEMPNSYKHHLARKNPLYDQVRSYIKEHFASSNRLLDSKLDRYSLSDLEYINDSTLN